MKNKNHIWPLLLVTFIVCLIITAIFLFVQRAQARSERPLVLIHSPYPHQIIDLGQGIAIHATARSATGINEMELWIDDQLLAAQGASSDENSLQVLHSIWQPLTTGEHTVAIRAVSTRGVTGQSLITVEVTGISDSSPTMVEILPSELQDTSTTTTGTTAEEMIASAEDEDPAAGDAPVIPEGASLPEGDDGFPDEIGEISEPLLPSEEGIAPGSDLPSPDSWDGIFENLSLREERIISDDGETTLRLEILSLDTGLDYEQMHCYLGLGDLSPRWVPDLDLDPSTDESFLSLGGGNWDVFSILGGENASVYPWPADTSLPLDIRCVEITSGGTDALELGRLQLSINPESWDGITRRAESDVREGHFLIDYRVTKETGFRGFPVELDPDLTPPTNLSVGWWSLTWDYLPEPDEPEIHGFRIYLNGAYQWRVPADSREAYLPFEWFNPPCGTDYSFTVTAYYLAEDGADYESHPAYPPVVTSSGEIRDEGCDRTIRVNFKTLTIGSLGRDGDREDSNGPAYGSLFANEHISHFDGRCGRDDPCGIMRLYENQDYDLHYFTTTLGDGTPPRFTLQVPQSEGINIGFEIWDEDPGRGDDDLICSVTETIESDDLNTPHTRILSSDYDRCQVEVEINIALGSPVGGSDGEPPLPLLTVTDLSVDESTGQLLIHLLNEGSATWAGYDLDALVRWPSGEPIGAYVIPELVLLPGQSTIIRDPDLVPGPHPPLGA